MTTRNDGPYRLDGKRVFVAGHRGMVGAAVVRRLAAEPCEVLAATRGELDLRRQADVEAWMKRTRPQVVVVAAAKVGGILANNTRPAEFLYENLAIQTSIIHAAKLCEVEKLLFLGSSCIYPRMAEQPIREESLLTGPLEPTNEWYAVAKIAGIKMCQAYRRQYGCDFISAMPTNLYGPHDNYDLVSSHVAAALLVKAHRAKLEGRSELEVWGTGTPRREFMYVDDLADALVFLLKHYSGEEHVNVGVASDVTIRELAETVMRVVGLNAELRFDRSKPDGTPRKLMDSSRLFAMGWTPKTSLENGFSQAYAWYLANEPSLRAAS
jgi:GDP-L-fucose synthase